MIGDNATFDAAGDLRHGERVDDKRAWIMLAAAAVGLYAASVWLDYREHQVAVRSHNLDVFYKSLTCGDLPLGSDTNEAACEQAIGKFMLPEEGLFTR